MNEADPDKVSAEGGIRGVCPNCHSMLLGPYCASCGQSADSHRRSVHRLLHEFLQDIFSFDSRILRTAGALLFRPGELAVAFREGRTQRYVPPVRLYLFVSLFFFVALAYSNIAVVQFALSETLARTDQVITLDTAAPGEKAGAGEITVGSRTVFFAPMGSVASGMSPPAQDRFVGKVTREISGHNAGWLDRAVAATLIKLARDPTALNGAISEWLPRALFLVLPLFALILAAFHLRHRKQYFFVDHLVFSLGMHSFAFVAVLAAVALSGDMSGALAMKLLLAVLELYLVLAMRRFYRQNWFWTCCKAAGVTAGYIVFVLMPALIGVFLMGVLHG
jgi:hypothetical protein